MGSEVTEVIGCVDVPLTNPCCEAACSEHGSTVFACQVFARWVRVALEGCVSHQGDVVGGYGWVTAHGPETNSIIIAFEVGEHVDDDEVVSRSPHKCESCVAVRHVRERLVGFRQDRCIGIRVSEDVHVARCKDVPCVEPVPVLVASREVVRVADVWPSVVVEANVEAGWVVDLNPAV